MNDGEERSIRSVLKPQSFHFLELDKGGKTRRDGQLAVITHTIVDFLSRNCRKREDGSSLTLGIHY